VTAGVNNEAIVFADRNLEEDLLGQLRVASIAVEDIATNSVGTALRIRPRGEPRRFFELVFKWWERNRKNGALVTFRASSGLTVELRDSTLLEVRKVIEHS
jgi:hypothetical protein